MNDRILQLARDAIERAGFEIVHLAIDGRRNIRARVDREGGINIGDCTTLNKAVRQALADDGLDPGSFHVEVQSPGIDRPLVRDSDYARFAGQDVAVRLKVKRGDRRAFRGKLVGLEAGQVKVECPEGPLSFDLAREVEEVRLDPKLSVPTEGEVNDRRNFKRQSGRHKRK